MDTRRAWLQILQRLADPVLTAAATGRLARTLQPECAANCEPDRLASSHLEAVGRLLLGIAPWLAGQGGDAAEKNLRQRYGDSARQAIVNGCTPDHADNFQLHRGQQPIVDMAFVACALYHARSVLWDPLTSADQTRIIEAFCSLRNRKPYFNNWLLCAAASECFLKQVGGPWDPMRVDYALSQHAQWYVGDGHYGDGPHFHADWYNSYVIHPLLHTIVESMQGEDPRWQQLYQQEQQRFQRYAAVQERCIAPDGSFPVIGRSLCYRCGAFHALAYAAWQNLLPSELPPAQVRCALDAVIHRTLAPSACWRADGFLRIGMVAHQPALGEVYITTGSLYLAACALLPLALPPEAPFWRDADQPWSSRQLFDLGSNGAADHALVP